MDDAVLNCRLRLPWMPISAVESTHLNTLPYFSQTNRTMALGAERVSGVVHVQITIALVSKLHKHVRTTKRLHQSQSRCLREAHSPVRNVCGGQSAAPLPVQYLGSFSLKRIST